MLSLCLAVHDSLEGLQPTLARMRPVVREILVAAVGARDTAEEEALRDAVRGFGVRLLHLPWRDDLAAVRNALLREVTRPWVLMLEPGERIAESQLPLLAMLTAGQPRIAYRMHTRNYVRRSEFVSQWHPCRGEFSDEPVDGGWYPSVSARVFPNRPGVHFRYNVFETVEPSLRACGIIAHVTSVAVHNYRRRAPADEQRRHHAFLESLCRRKIEEDRDLPQARLELARLLVAQERLSEARMVYTDLVQRDPAHMEATEELAWAHFRQGRVSRAASTAERAAHLAPNSSESWSALALATLELGRPYDAVIAARQAVRTGPQSPMAHYALGATLLATEQPCEGEAALERALILDPLHQMALLRLGMHEREAGRRQRARQLLAQAVELGPSCPKSHAMLGELMLANGEIDEARVHLQQACTLRPDCPDALSFLAMLHIHDKQPARARGLLSRALHIKPDHDRARQCLRSLDRPQ